MSEATQGAVSQEQDEVTLGDSRVQIETYDRYKGRKGVTDRIAILSPTLVRTRAHFYREKKKTIVCLSKPGAQAVCCDVLGLPEQTFGLILFHYTTDTEGQFLPGTETRCTGKVKFWKISETRYTELTGVHKQFPLMSSKFGDPHHDLMVKCTEENFQRMAFTPAKDAHFKTKEEWYKTLIQLMEKGKPKLKKVMGSEMSLDEVRKLLEVDSGRPAVNPSQGDVDVDSILADITPETTT